MEAASGPERPAKLPEKAEEAARVAALNKYLFEENGFHGSRTDYYHRANSYLSRVIDDREGLPITLSILYMELARRLDVKIVGIGVATGVLFAIGAGQLLKAQLYGVAPMSPLVLAGVAILLTVVAILATMIREAGFSRVSFSNYTGGIAALHSGWKL